MAQKTLNAFVVIGGRVDNTFGQIGTALVSMGATIDEISTKLINFGKESIEVYRSYQDSMLDAQVALSTTYGRGSRELNDVMRTLDAQATEWAASTIFHTDDVASAIAQAAHANWDLEMILEGMPVAMRLAQAGGMDLSEALDFIIKSANGAGIEFGNLSEFVDEWVFAANSSAGNVEEFGEAMMKMGNTMMFAGNKEELLAMLAILHDYGTTGPAAGTLLRNSMIRLIAPTKKASDAMLALGITQEDVDEAMAEVDGDTAAAVQRLEELGFSVYDSSGNLKNFLEIFRDLDLVTRNMSDEEKYAIWSAIFPTKTITGGMALIESAEESLNGLYGTLRDGGASGYGEYASETMMSGLTGSIETFLSKVERLKQVTGEALSDDVTYWTDKLGELVDSVAGMDEASFNALVSGLEVIAVAGPGLLVAGSAFRFLGFALGTNTGRIALAALAIGALASAVSAYNEKEFENKFGDMTLDMEPIRQHLQQLTEPFQEARKEVEAFGRAMDTALQAYTTQSSELSSGLVGKLVTGATLTEEDKESFMSLGDDIYNSVMDGINRSYDAAATSLALYADEGDSDILAPILSILELQYGEAISKAESLSGQLREALTSAFADGHLTGEEVENIQSILNELNELLAMQTHAENYAEQQRLMRKSQTLGLEGLNELSAEVIETRDNELEQLMQDRDREHALMEGYLRQHMGEYYTDTEGIEHLIDDEFINGMLSDIDGIYNEAITERRAVYDEIMLEAFDNAIHTSDLADANGKVEDLVNTVLSGGMTLDEALDELAASDYNKGTGVLGLGPSLLKNVSEYTNREIEALGGLDAVTELANSYYGKANAYRQQGDEETAQRFDTYANRYWGLLLRKSLADDAALRRMQEMNPLDVQKTDAGISKMTYQGFANYDPSVVDPYTIPLKLDGAEAAAAGRSEAEGVFASPIEGSVDITNASSEGASARSEIESQLDNITANVSVRVGGGLGTNHMAAMADGGRATEPAIYGEAGPEWFIPERHDANTAKLIAAAAHASGFSLAELAARSGARLFAEGGVFGNSSIADSAALAWGSLDYGGSGSGDNTTFDVHYNPVIHAENADGVDQALRADKKRMKQLLQELMEERELYRSVVSYA